MNLLWFLEGIRTPAGNDFFQFVTCFGQETFLLSVLCFFYWCYDKKFARRIGLTYFSSGLVVQNLKLSSGSRVPGFWILISIRYKALYHTQPATPSPAVTPRVRQASLLHWRLGPNNGVQNFSLPPPSACRIFPDVSWRPYSKGCADFPCDLPWVLCGVLPVCRYSVSEDPYFVCRTGGDFLFRTCLSLSSSEI